jgi:hypothetical protein
MLRSLAERHNPISTSDRYLPDILINQFEEACL